MKWHIRDIIDLEYFLHQDAAASSAKAQELLNQRNRAIFLDHVVPATRADAPPDRQFLIRTWLDWRREEVKSTTAVLPGESFDSLSSSLRTLFLIAGLVLGAATAASFLAYNGDRPVNVFVYLALFIASQLLLLMLLLGLSLYRLSTKTFPAASPLSTLIGRTILRMLLSTRDRSSRKLAAEQRLQTEAVLGTIIAKPRTYGPLVFLPIFLLTQLFAIGFNLGLLGATLFKVVTADIAFGWQSTLQLSPAAVHTLAQQIAWPWSWAIQGDAAYPSLSQIEGSRIILKEGIYHLATPDLVSWWPFLCLAVLGYGLLPRLLLFLGAVFSLRRQLSALDFRQGIYEQLLQRMTTPLMTTRGQSVRNQGPAETASCSPVPEQTRKATPGGIAARNLLVLIPDEIHDSCSPEEIEAVVNRRGRYRIAEIIRTGQDYARDRELLAALPNREGMAETDILLIQEAWQPPIMEHLDFLRQLRQAAGRTPCIRIGLIGKAQPDTIFTPAAEDHRQIWTRKIAVLGDPCIFCEGLVDHAP